MAAGTAPARGQWQRCYKSQVWLLVTRLSYGIGNIKNKNVSWKGLADVQWRSRNGTGKG